VRPFTPEDELAAIERLNNMVERGYGIHLSHRKATIVLAAYRRAVANATMAAHILELNERAKQKRGWFRRGKNQVL